MSGSAPRVVVVGAGVGGLTTAAALARAGLEVTVLEAQVYPGGSASTYFHQGYRFDAGATLAAGFYPGGPMDKVAQATGIASWPARPTDTAMIVHLPGGQQVPRRAGDSRWEDIRTAFGQPGVDFFRWQERAADALWELALRQPPWPPQSPTDLAGAAAVGLPWLVSGPRLPLTPDAFRPVASRLGNASEALRLFVDGQLLISAQAESDLTNALYGASALDLPRRGLVHLTGGMGAIAETLAAAVRGSAGQVLFRHEVTRILMRPGQPASIETKRGGSFEADIVFANLPPWNVRDLIEGPLPSALRRLSPRPRNGWGAFMLYVGLDDTIIPPNFPLHHQVLADRPLGEGNSVFLSLSPAWDASRAPAGQRALTISTHTSLDGWWDLFENDRPAYEARKAALTEKVFNTAEIALPGLREAARLVLPGTPVTFQRFTRRAWGWVGGFPQTSLFSTFGPRLDSNLWMVGDSIFPGQSTAAVALGGLRVAQAVLRQIRQ